ncbi:MAG: T9SS type A sorting domain-containing protein [Fibrobacteria bacterium]|nr:T9SS type A sorting domain-containing protein [Fibrobacteria bacterium]
MSAMNMAFSSNPFYESTQLRFKLLAPQQVMLEIFNADGNKVRTEVSGILPVGSHALSWSGLDDKGRELGAGQYFARLRIGQKNEVHRLIMLR